VSAAVLRTALAALALLGAGAMAAQTVGGHSNLGSCAGWLVAGALSHFGVDLILYGLVLVTGIKIGHHCRGKNAHHG
jgi:hypothetical protein